VSRVGGEIAVLPGFRRETEGGVLRIVFDRPGDKVNLLDGRALEALERVFIETRGREDVTGILLTSAKPGMFLAGMDVEEIASLTDPFAASEGARRGQKVFAALEALPIPSVAAIGGPCLGGGLELALACTMRVAADDPAVSLGLPEVQLGILPGFGGTQRLPRLIGLPAALDLILTGKRLDARRAQRLGLVDRIAPPAYLEREALALLGQASAAQGRLPRGLRRPRPLLERAMVAIPPLRRALLRKAERATEKRVRRADYPAPYLAIRSMGAAFEGTEARGFDIEAGLVGELIATSTSKNLIWLFKSQGALKKDAGVQAAPRKVKRAAVLGAGIMGGGIAQLLADRGIPVRLKDVRQEALLAALRHADGLWRKQVARKRLSPREHQQRREFISTTTDDTGFSHVDLVIEAVVEDLAVKQKVLSAIEEHTPDRTVFASNTSSLPIGDIAARAMRPERVVGLHFFNPVHRMPLVEVIAGSRTSPETVATAHALAIELGKTPVVVRDSPGFLVNRVLMPYMNEALRLLAEGLSTEAVDAAMTAFGMPVGPLALLDQVGLDTARHVAGVLQGAFGRRMGGGESVLEAMVGDGRLGAKNGRGFYRYRDGESAGPDPDALRLAGAPGPRQLPPETLQERMVLSMINEAAVCLEDGVVREPREVDVAMVLGTGFPPFRGGLLRHADAVGVPVVVDRLTRLADSQGERFRPAGLLRDMVRLQARFYPEG
jgi:3-hydroxyacyl-CoA dehydrogenase/enoyl-CoA hydratase/3-hydroxybutyryl-CoA epimerase